MSSSLPLDIPVRRPNNLPLRNLFKVLEDNPAPEPDDTPRDDNWPTGSLGSENSEGSEAGTLEEVAMGVDVRRATSMPAASDIDPGTCIRPDIGIGIGIGIGIDTGIDIGIGIGIGIGIDIGIGDGPGVFEAGPVGLPVPCRWDDMYHQKPGFAVCLRVFNAFASS